MSRPFKYFLLVIALCLGCNSEKEPKVFEIGLIPKPQQLQKFEGSLSLNGSVTFYADSEFKIATDFLLNFLQNGMDMELEKAPKERAFIILIQDSTLPPEGYSVDTSEEQIIIKAADDGGAYYGVQTLRQLLPPSIEEPRTTQSAFLPRLKIVDAPKFKYRGMHLDVGRHFFSKEFIKEYIANMSLLKMNYFHWHLTEDQGWRIEIKKYPKLTTHAAYREETLIGHYNETPQQFDGTRYGGFYSQEDIKEIVAFATRHNVTIIPEIEMPGHAQAAISAYPELGCTGEQVPVATKWGVFENIYCPNQKTFEFLQDVLTEVIELFPGEYIHIGGDEAPKSHWKNCDHCQKLIADLDLKDEHELQSYFIKKIETFVNSKGKKIIGWDEILEGGLAPNATVMSWRGTAGAVQAAKEQHQVILTPTSHAYFDYYQDDHPDEPLAIGGFLPLKKVYSFNPIPSELNIEETKYVLGAQGNVWTEYIKTEDKVEYMAYPRMLAMSEVVWSGASENLEADYADFLSRLEIFNKRLDVLDVNYANHLYNIEGEIKKEKGQVNYLLKTPTDGKQIKYSLNAAEEKIYSDPIAITEDTHIKAQVFREEETLGRPFNQLINYHKGISGTVTLNVNPHPAYSSGGKEALINGISGSADRYGDKEWLGFWGDDLEITIDLGEENKLDSILMRFYNANGQWIYSPTKVSVKGYLANGKLYTSQVNVKPEMDSTLVDVKFDFSTLPRAVFRTLTFIIPSYGNIPEGSQGAGNKAWTFIDEIIIK